MVNTCGICGDVVRTDVSPNWHPIRQLRRAQRDMQRHMDTTHSFAEVLRYEMRQDLEQVPDEQRPSIVRDVYRSLLGTTTDGVYALGSEDSVAAYGVDEVLGSLPLYQLWLSAEVCGLRDCVQH
jgi:hypothetical protein